MSLAPAALLLGLLSSSPAEAFCGFYVSGADAELYANATMVALMREGTTTVLSMQNDYQGPTEDFAMVVPVPVVLQKENVRTLPPEIFKRLDQLAAPRLVEYWEQDPCQVVLYERMKMAEGIPAPSAAGAFEDEGGVTVEAQFEVGEYDIVILSASDSGGLDKWLRKNAYNIPQGAEAVLRPYVQAGTKFFVAKVDSKRVTFEQGRAVLSPLRVHYDSPDFALPVRLGLLNSEGEQDLLVHILARGQRYQVANYENTTIPTNIRVNDGVREDFGGFYDQLFSKTVQGKPKTVVTEYSWDAGSCDPCPVPAMDEAEILTLGGDVTGNASPWDYTLTRLHYRYTAEHLGEDLVFEAAPPIVGGRGMPDDKGMMREQGSQSGGSNAFQGRYVILHPWDGPITCEDPVRGHWGGPLEGPAPGIRAAGSKLGQAEKTSSGVALASLVDQDVPEIGLTKAAAPAGDAGKPPEGAAPADKPATPDGSTPADVQEDEPGCAVVAPVGGLLALGLPLLAVIRRRR